MATLYLIPNLLSDDTVNYSIPKDVQEIALSLQHFIVENEKVSRRFLKKIDREKDINICSFYPMGKHANTDAFASYLKVLKGGTDMGMISDAGCPAVADPGHKIVQMAHKENIPVVPLTGPSSIMLALMASGLNGQNFHFHGYLPHDAKERSQKIKWLEREALNNGTTQIFMDTPFRNNKLIQEIVDTCNSALLLSVAAEITAESESIITRPISQWKKTKFNYHKIPVMLCLGQ